MNELNVTVDLETFGTGNDAVILSIGAVKHTATEIVDRFHVGVDPASCQQLGLKMDAATVLWWMNDDLGAAREALLGLERVDLPSALVGFSQWFGSDPLPIWGNGSTFDNVILRSAYAACHLEYPTRFWNDLCYRTMKTMFPGLQPEREGIHHDALDDATYQARHWMAIVQHLGDTGATADIVRMRELLGEAAATFRRYEANHREKAATAALDQQALVSTGKADANKALAEKIEALLA